MNKIARWDRPDACHAFDASQSIKAMEVANKWLQSNIINFKHNITWVAIEYGRLGRPARWQSIGVI